MERHKIKPILHKCGCQACRQYPYAAAAKEHRAINQVLATLDEKYRRRFVGILTLQQRYDSIQQLIEVTGRSRNTIVKGRTEVQRSESSSLRGRTRRPGGGRQMTEKKSPRF